MVGIFKEMVNNVRIFTFLIEFVESCWQILGSLTNVVPAARAMIVIDHI